MEQKGTLGRGGAEEGSTEAGGAEGRHAIGKEG